MRILSLAALLAFPAMITSALAQDGMVTLSPAQIGQIFCIARLGNDMAPVEGLLTPDLAKTIADAEARSDAWATANPGEKPPLGDGVPWQAWPDYAPECTVGAVTITGEEATVELTYNFADTPHAEFTDTLLLTQVDDPMTDAKLWRLDNITYVPEGDLRSALIHAFDT